LANAKQKKVMEEETNKNKKRREIERKERKAALKQKV